MLLGMDWGVSSGASLLLGEGRVVFPAHTRDLPIPTSPVQPQFAVVQAAAFVPLDADATPQFSITGATAPDPPEVTSLLPSDLQTNSARVPPGAGINSLSDEQFLRLASDRISSDCPDEYRQQLLQLLLEFS